MGLCAHTECKQLGIFLEDFYVATFMIFKKTTCRALSVTFLVLAGFSLPAVSDIQVKFTESAPKDRFSFSNLSKCQINALKISIDLSESSGQLIFDTTSTGAGVEVFQPFEVLKGNIDLISAVSDGDNKLVISIDSINAEETVSFTIDVDDTLTQSELGKIRVTGSEIQGGKVAITVQDETPMSAVFGDDSSTLIKMSNCDK